MMLVTIDSIPGKEYEVLGIAKGTIVQSKNVGRDFMAAIKNSGRWRNCRLHRNAQ